MNVITHKFNILHGLDREKFSDLKLVTECGQKVSCHKVVVAAASTKLRASLEKRPTNELVVRNVKYNGLVNLMNFIYNGKVQIGTTGELQDFADSYTLLNINLGPKVGEIVKKINLTKSDSETDHFSQETGFKCENCEKVFPTRKKLSRHIREVHKPAPPKVKPSYTCENCGVVYTVGLDLHLFV